MKTLEKAHESSALAALLRQHFDASDAGLPSPLELQEVGIAGNRAATLFYAPTPPANPFLVVSAPDGGVAWTKPRPLAGTRQVVTEMVLTPGPHGELALLWCDIPTQIVALRRWDADGVPLADFAVVEMDLCGAVGGLYWPGRGWVTVASAQGPARAQLLDERGARAWGAKGVELPWAARPSAPASVFVDSPSSVIVLQVGERARGGAVPEDRVLAMRYDASGAPLWIDPVDVGSAQGAPPTARLEVSEDPSGSGGARLVVALPSANASSPTRRVALRSDGRLEAR